MSVLNEIEMLEAKQAELKTAAEELERVKGEISDYEARKEALKQESERIQADISAKRETRRTEDLSFQEKLRAENLESAKKKFFADFNYTEEQKAQFLDQFKGYDSGAVNADLIERDMIRAHTALNADHYIAIERRQKQMEEAGGDFLKDMSSGASDGHGFEVRTNDSGLTDDERRAAQWAGIPEPEYKRLKSEGKL